MMENKKDSSHKPTHHHHHRSKKHKTMDGSIESLSGETPTPKFIPQEIIEEILLRLPGKSLLRFRCVSKSWLSLISSPEFIKTHVTYSNLDPALSNYRVMLGVSYDPIHDQLKHDSVRSVAVGDFSTDVLKNDDCPIERREWELQLNGSCNGLLCVSAYRDNVTFYLRTKHTFLWNPCLRTSKKLPPVTAKETQLISVAHYGMGYDEPNDDYKVAGLFLYLCQVSGGLKLMVQIYSLKTDSWKRIDDFKGGPFEKYSPVIFAGGKFHFLETFIGVDAHSSYTVRNIVSVDLANGAYGTIEQPKRVVGRFSWLSILILNGCISAVYNFERDRADVWALMEYGVAESWTKLVSVPYNRVGGPPSDYRFPYRLCMLWNGKYLLRYGGYRVVYDPRDDSFVYPARKGKVAGLCSTVIYAESLVGI